MYKLFKYNIKLIFSFNAFAACLIICFTPIFFDLSNMDYTGLIKMGELYLSLSGMFLLISLGSFEASKFTWEFVYMQKISYVKICFGRLVGLMMFNAFIIFIPLAYVYLKSANITFFDGYIGTVATSWFLGLIGLLVAEIFDDYKIAYAITFAYYFIGTSVEGILGFHLLGYYSGNISSKNGVLFSCLFIVIVYLMIIKLKCKYGYK